MHYNHFRNIGVVGVDATLDEIENFLTKHQWGDVYSFLIDKNSETVYHKRLKASTNVSDIKLGFIMYLSVCIAAKLVNNLLVHLHEQCYRVDIELI